MRNPYETLPGEAFWRTAVTDRSAFDISVLCGRRNTPLIE